MKKKINILSVAIGIVTIGMSCFSCARTTTKTGEDKVLQFTFKVKGSMILNRNDVTYYLILDAPETDNIPAGGTIPVFDPNVGPRINAPDITKGIQFLEGRLPFIGQLPNDLPSKWTDFYFITANTSGKPYVGRGRLDATGNPTIYDTAYSNQNTKAVSGTDGKINGYQIELSISDLNNGHSLNSSVITANLATSDSIDNGGNGYIFDSWRGTSANVPFAISLTSESPQAQQDISNDLVMRKIISRPDPVLPVGVNPDDVNITEYSARVICDVSCDIKTTT